MLRANGRDKIDRETPYVKRIYERDYPFDNGRPIVVVFIAEYSECDCQRQLNQDEHQLDPERDA